MPWPFEREYMQLALIAGVVVGACAPLIGAYLVQKRMSLMGDGLFWRRAVDPNFDAHKVLPILVGLVSTLLNPVEPAEAVAASASAPARSKTEAAQ